MSIPVIGTGAISAAGCGVETGWSTLLSGMSFLKPLSIFDTRTGDTPLVGEVPSDLFTQNCYSRTEALALTAVREAMAGIDTTGYRLGLTVSTTVGGLDHSEKFYERLKTDPSLITEAPTEFARHEPAALTAFLAKEINANGCHTLSTACSTAVHGIGIAAEMIRSGAYDLVLAVGTDALSLLTFRGFDSLLLVDYDGSAPFDKNRLGISLGEAAGAILLASPEYAESLSTPPKGYVSGWGASADAYHMTAPEPEGRGAKESALKAMNQAGISSQEVDWICAHGTGTPDNDKAEINAMKSLFDPLPPFTSMKGAIGHTLAASGAIETVYALEAFTDNTIPGTCGFENEDPEIGASPSLGEEKDISIILKNSFGFGGNNGSLILSKEPLS